MSDRRSGRGSAATAVGDSTLATTPAVQTTPAGANTSPTMSGQTTAASNAAPAAPAAAAAAGGVKLEERAVGRPRHVTPTAVTGDAMEDTPAAAASGGTKRGKQSIRASDLKRKKLVPRCSSPSHFLTEENAAAAASSSAGFTGASPLPSALSSDPNAPSAAKLAESNTRIDSYLHSIGSMYYRNQVTLGKETSGPAEVWVSSDYDKLEYPTLDLLISPLRKPNVLDNWCPREIALFEAGICAVGKDFHAISNMISTKSCKECVDFYYVWKKSSHYAMWKNFGKPSKKPHANKEEQWKAIREQMKGPTTRGTADAQANGTAAVKE